METQLLVLTIGHAISAVLTLTVGTFVLFKGVGKLENFLFFLLTFFTGAFNVYAGIGINLEPSALSYNVWFLNILNVFITTSYFHFMLRAIDRHVAFRWLIRSAYAIAFFIFGAALIYPHMFLPEVTAKLYLKSYLNSGPLYHAMLTFFVVYPLIAFFELVRAYFRGGFDKLRAEYYIATSILGYGIGLWSFALVYNLPVDPILGVLVGLYTIPIAYGIVSKQLLDIRVAFKRAFFYALGIAAIAALLVVLIFLNDFFVAQFPILQFWTIPLVASAAAVFLGRTYWLQALENDRLKYEFISIATHKLRTPLTRIKWEVSSILDAAKDNQVITDAMKRIDDANGRLISLTNVLVEASETEDIYYGYKKKYFDIRDVALKAVERVHPLIEKKNLHTKVQLADKTSLVNGDPDRIASAMDVFLENACMYSHEGGEIRISLIEEKKEIVFTVSDDGIGFSQDERKNLFTRFFRSYNAKVTDTEGMGLGLSMAKSIIDKHHGEISATSAGQGKGATFSFSIPV